VIDIESITLFLLIIILWLIKSLFRAY